MKNLFYLLCFFCVCSLACAEVNAPYHLLVENKTNPLGIDVSEPRFSWWLNDSNQGASQTSYELRISEIVPTGKPEKVIWESKKINSAQSVNVTAKGFSPKPAVAYTWQVRYWDKDNNPSAWSEQAYFEMGLMHNDAWKDAKWIAHPERDYSKSTPPAYLRNEFNVSKKIVRARLYATARGLFQAWINGTQVGNDYFTPGWTDYRKTNQYLVYDVTPLLNKGDNVIGTILGDGWYSGYMFFQNTRHGYGQEPALKLRLDITYEDGSMDSICSDESWKVSTGPMLDSDFYNGENYDANLEIEGWNKTGYDISKWKNVQICPEGNETLIAKVSQPVRVIESLYPKFFGKASNGELVLDFKQNMVGILRLTLSGKKGQKITIRYAEMLNEDGTLYTANLRSAKSTDSYTFGKDGSMDWSPTFTFHGFRYIGISGIEDESLLNSLENNEQAQIDFTKKIEGLVLHNDMPKTGTFSCSDPLINQLQSNIVWGQRGNFLEVPTDCPQRDERLGWTGDAQIFARTATFNYDVRAFFEKWMKDVRDAQFPDGAIPHIVPAKPDWHDRGAAAWADAVAVVPWVIYQQYGDCRILEENYDAMKRWVEYMKATATEGIRREEGFGDWLALDRPGNPAPHETDTPKALVGTAYFAHSTDILAQTAEILGKKDDAKQYNELHSFVRNAFIKKFVKEDGSITGNTQTVYLLALAFDLLPHDKRQQAIERLVADIRTRNWHLSTGFVGTGIMMPTLDAIGRQDVAFKLLKQDTYPGWLYSIHQGATTMWERWNSYTKDNGFGDVNMNSFNHYAYGAVGEWMYARIGGLSALEPGFKKSLIQPIPGGGITFAQTELATPYGQLSCHWKIADGKFKLNAVIPPNTTATVILPNGDRKEVSAGKYDFEINWIK